MKWAASAVILGVLGASMASEAANAMALNRCVKIVRNLQVNRETLVNTCPKCLVAKVERRRPGSATGTPNMRDFTLPPGASQPLPFLGPGHTRITSEAPCPQAP